MLSVLGACGDPDASSTGGSGGSGGAAGSGGAGVARLCTKWTHAACACPGDVLGSKKCLGNEMEYGPCECPASTSSSSAGTGGAGGSGGGDACIPTAAECAGKCMTNVDAACGIGFCGTGCAPGDNTVVCDQANQRCACTDISDRGEQWACDLLHPGMVASACTDSGHLPSIDIPAACVLTPFVHLEVSPPLPPIPYAIWCCPSKNVVAD